MPRRPRNRAPRASRAALVHDVQVAFAHSTQTIFYIMAAVMAAGFLVAIRYVPRGKVAPHEELAGAQIAAAEPRI